MPPLANELDPPERPQPHRKQPGQPGRARVAVWFPEFSPWRIGGAEFRVVQGLRLLAGRCDVTLITRRAPPPDTLDAQYGGWLGSGGFRMMALDDRYRWIPGDSLRRQCRDAMVRHHLARHGSDYDLVLGMLNTVDCPQGGVHWIVDCMFDAELYRHVTGTAARPGQSSFRRLASRRPPGRRREFSGTRAARGRRCSGPWAVRAARQIAADPRNRLVVNSRWMAEAVAACYGVAPPTVLYPPVVAEFPDVPWQDREPGFVVVGRVGPEKRLDTIVDIVDAVRQAGHENCTCTSPAICPTRPTDPSRGAGGRQALGGAGRRGLRRGQGSADRHAPLRLARLRGGRLRHRRGGIRQSRLPALGAQPRRRGRDRALP